MNGWEFTVLTTAPIIGGMAALLIKKQSKENYRLVLSFSGAFLFSITLIHLLPVVFSMNPLAGVYVLAGFFIQIFLEQLTHGIEHGHFHEHSERPSYIFALLLGLSLHSFLDGIPLSNHQLLEEGHHSLLYGISLHKIPEGFALASVLLFSNYRKITTFSFLILFSLIAPAATLFCQPI
jgi:zinc transporter ZupT